MSKFAKDDALVASSASFANSANLVTRYTFLCVFERSHYIIIIIAISIVTENG